MIRKEYMKKLTLLFACCALLGIACNHSEKSVDKQSITINGSLANSLKLGDKLSLRISGENSDIATTTADKDGNFSFTVNVEKEQFLTLYVKDSPLREIITDSQDITVSKNGGHVEINGSRYNDIWFNFKERVKPYVGTLESSMNASDREKAQRELLEIIDALIVENRDNPTSIKMLEMYIEYGGDEKRTTELFTLINKKYSYLSNYQYMENIYVGKNLVDLKLNDVNGVQVSLSDVAKEGKWVLINYWALWKPASQKDTQYLVEAYDKFSAHGFEIYSVAFGRATQKSEWRDLVNKNELKWINVWGSGNNGSMDAGKPYFVYDVPANFLYSPEGKLVAKNIHGEDIDKILSEHIK